MELRVTQLSRFCRQLSLFALALSFPAFAQQPSANPMIMGFPVPQAIDTQVTPSTVEIHPRQVTLGPDSTFGRFYIQDNLKLGRAFDFVVSFSLNTNSATKKVPDGWYLMTLAVIYKDTSDLKTFAPVKSPYERLVSASAPTPVQVINGQPVRSTSVSLRFDNLTAVAVQHDLYFELLPLEKNCGKGPCVRLGADGQPDLKNSDMSRIMKNYRPYRAMMSVIPFMPKFSAMKELESQPTIIKANQTVASWVMAARSWQFGQTAAVQTQTYSPRAYAQAAGLHYLSLNSPELDQVSKAWLKGPGLRDRIRAWFAAEGSGTLTFAAGYSKALPALCAMLASRANYAPAPEDIMTSTEHARLCRGLWANSIYLTRTSHIGKVDRSDGKKLGFFLNSQFNYNVSMNFIRARSRSRDLYIAMSVKPVGMAGKVLDTLGVFNPTSFFDWTWSVSETNSQTRVEQGLTSATETLHFNPTDIVIPTAGTQQCLMVTAAPSAYPFYNSANGAKNGLYICDETPREMDVREIYAHIFTYPTDTSTARAFDPGTQTMNRSFRGDRDLAQALYRMRNSIVPVHGPEVFPSAPVAAAEAYFSATPSIANMMVVNPIEFAKNWIPTTTEMLTRNYREKFMDETQPR